MKFCANTYSFGRYSQTLSLYEMLDKCAAMGFDGVEFNQDSWLNDDPEALRAIGNYARSLGLETVALCVGADLVNGSAGDLDQEVEYLCGQVDRAAHLGVTKMRHDVSGGVYHKTYGLGYASVLPRLAEGCRRVTEYAAAKGIQTMTENHGFFSQDADRVASLIDAVAHPNFGALLDLGNFLCADETPNLSVSRLAPYAFHVHCKDFLYKSGSEIHPGAGWFRTRAGNYLRGTIVGHGIAGIPQSLGILKRIGYDHWISIEFEGVEDNLVGLAMGLDNAKRFWDNV